MIDITVKTLDSQNHSFSLDDDITVRGFKEHIAESVAVPADSQRLIYCGRVLQDEKKLNDYDVNGKVIHLVQRAPPQPGQRGNGGNGGNHSQSTGQNMGRTHRPYYQIIRDLPNTHTGTNAQVHGNRMYLGAMTLPAEVIEGHNLPVPQLSNTLSKSRVATAKRMLTSANRIMDRLDIDLNLDTSQPDRSSQLESAGPAFMSQDDTIEMEAGIFQPVRNSQRDSDDISNEVKRMEDMLSMVVMELLAICRQQNGASATEDNNADIHEIEVSTSNDTQSETVSQQQSHESSMNEEPGNSGRSRWSRGLPRPPQMAELLEMLMNTHNRLQPYLERYRILMSTDPVLSSTVMSGPDSVAENQHIVDEVSGILHHIAHANHALSDIIIHMGQAPPRNLSCHPIIVQQSAILQAGIPIQLEAHISLLDQNTSNNNNNSTEESNSVPVAPNPFEATGSTESREAPTQEYSQQQNSSSSNQQQNTNQQQHPDQQQQHPDQPQQRPDQQQQQSRPDQQQSRPDQQQSRPDQQQSRPDQQQSRPDQQQQFQTPFGNLLSNMFNLPSNVEVLMDVSPDSSMDINGSDDQSSNVGTNSNNNAAGNMNRITSGVFPWGSAPPTDFIRSLVHAMAGHIVHDPVGLVSNQTTNGTTVTINQQTIGVTIDSNVQNSGQSTQARNNVGTHPTTSTQTRSTSRPHVFQSPGTGSDSVVDPFLPCNSHHFRRFIVNARQNASSRNQAESQAAASSSGSNSMSSTPSTPLYIDGDTYLDKLRDGLGDRRFRQIREELAHSLRNLVRTLSKGKVDVRYSGNIPAGTTSIMLADLFENREENTNSLSTHVFGWEGNFLVDLSVLLAQNISLEGFVSLRFCHYEAISDLRRPLREFLQHSLSSAASPTILPDLFVERFLSCLKPYLVNILPAEKDANNRSIVWVDIVGTIEALLRRHFTDLFKRISDEEIDDATFIQDTVSILGILGTQICNVLRYLVVGGQVGLIRIAQRFLAAVAEDVHPYLRHWVLGTFMIYFRLYSTGVKLLSDSELLPLLVCEAQLKSSVSESSESSQSSDSETETEFSGHKILPSNWVPVISRDVVRQRRLAQEISSGGVPNFSDAYLGCLPCKRRKIIQQERQILVNPTSSHSTIAASIERLVKESVSRAGVAEVEGAAIAVASDLGVRSAFGQAIRDCFQPQMYRTPDFPDSSRFPNATKFFREDRQPKQ